MIICCPRETPIKQIHVKYERYNVLLFDMNTASRHDDFTSPLVFQCQSPLVSMSSGVQGYFTKKIKPSLAKPPLKLNGNFANLRLTSSVKSAAVFFFFFFYPWPLFTRALFLPTGPARPRWRTCGSRTAGHRNLEFLHEPHTSPPSHSHHRLPATLFPPTVLRAPTNHGLQPPSHERGPLLPSKPLPNASSSTVRQRRPPSPRPAG